MPNWRTLRKWLRNKPAMAGVGAAAAIGGYVLYRRKQTTGSTSSPSTSTTTPYTTASTYPNTYGTDVASALGGLDSQYAGQMQGFQAQLGDVQTALAALQTAGPAVQAPDTTNYAPSYTPIGVPASTSTQNAITVPASTAAQTGASSGAPTYRRVVAGDNWLNVAQGHDMTAAQLLALNASRGPAALKVGQTIQVGGAVSPATSPKAGASATPAYRRVVAGDNWATVAAGHSETLAQLLSLNARRGPGALHVGETIRVT